jgi:hypothetical protein
MTSSSALWTLAGARLISSASSRFAKTGPASCEVTGLLVVDARPDEVRRHEVGRELDALELATDGLGQGPDRHRLGEARDALDEDVAPREERDDQPLEQVILTDDDLLDLVQEPLHRGGSVLAWCVVHAAYPLLRLGVVSSVRGCRLRARFGCG